MSEREGSGLITDLYELTMAQSYLEHGMHAPATFSLFVRKLPPQRSYLVAAGLDDVLRYLEAWSFSADEIEYLTSAEIFSEPFLEHLAGVRFTGSVRAVPEGSLVFANEPLLEVTGPVLEAQIVETYIINQMNLQTMLATKASRCVQAAQGRTLVDFALRRTQGTDAGLKASRASYIAGFNATSNVDAGYRYGIPVSGTMAHSYVTAFESEVDAFRAFAKTFPDRCILLIDTYDTVEGAKKAAQVGRELEESGHRLRAVRLDSGDLLELSRQVRQVLDSEGLDYVQIFASGGLDEYEIDELLAAGAPVDGFGVGTKVGVSGDAPWLDSAYKLVEYDGRGVLKLSSGKPTYPGQKQVFRRYGEGERMAGDVLALHDEEVTGAEPLLQTVMDGGERLAAPEPLDAIRERFQREFQSLPEGVGELRDGEEYPVEVSDRLRQLFDDVSARTREKH